MAQSAFDREFVYDIRAHVREKLIINDDKLQNFA
jgi:hypothetical protein